MNIIETENLSYKYDESHFALSDLSIGFEKGKITTILGANGAGKSTLFLNCLLYTSPSPRDRG